MCDLLPVQCEAVVGVSGFGAGLACAARRHDHELAAAIPNFLCQEQVSLGDGYLKTPFKVENGYVPIPTGPGLGIELDDNQLADKLDHDWRNRETYDLNDGSVVDW